MQERLWTGRLRTDTQVLFEGLININDISKYLPQLHCDLKVSVISTGYKVTGTKIFANVHT